MSGTTRQQKYARLLQKELGDIFQRDKKGILDNAFISIIDVKVSPDLSVAKVYLSMLLEKDKQKVFDRIVLRKKEIRKELGLKIAKQVRIIPELVFFIDDVEENALRINDIINKLNIPPAPKE